MVNWVAQSILALAILSFYSSEGLACSGKEVSDKQATKPKSTSSHTATKPGQ